MEEQNANHSWVNNDPLTIVETEFLHFCFECPLKIWGEFLRRAPALAKRRRMRGYDVVMLSAACNSPALFVQGLPGGVANTAANRNQIQWAGSVTLRAQARLIHVVSIKENRNHGKGEQMRHYLRQKAK